MRASAIFEIRRRWSLLPLAFGVWAAAIALSPRWTGKAILAAPAAIVPLLAWTLAKPARWIALFLGTALLLPPLPIPIGDSGPHPSLLFAAIGLFAGLLRAREWHWTSQSPAPQLVALLGVLLASVAAAAVPAKVTAATRQRTRVLERNFIAPLGSSRAR